MIEFLLLDLDNTILDFTKAEYYALGKTLRSFGIEPTDEVRQRYSQINWDHWERLERKELTREQVVVGRFETLLREFGICADAEAMAKDYEDNLAYGEHHYLPQAEETLERLCKKYKLYMVTNGTAHVQHQKLKASGVGKYFQDIFISQDMGADKPSPEYFNSCFDRIPNFDVRRAMIVGDSLSSDIKGGINMGMRTCWVNRTHKKGREDIPADFEIEYLHQIDSVLEKL